MDKTDTYTMLMQRALRYISLRRRSHLEIDTYLRKVTKGSQTKRTECEQVISRLTELGYIDDKIFAISFIRDRIRLHPRGMSLLRQELTQKGIAKETMSEAFAQLASDGTLFEDDIIRTLVTKKLRRTTHSLTLLEKQRLIVSVARKGFSYERVAHIVDDVIKKD